MRSIVGVFNANTGAVKSDPLGPSQGESDGDRPPHLSMYRPLPICVPGLLLCAPLCHDAIFPVGVNSALRARLN